MRAQVDKELRETEAEENQQKKSRLVCTAWMIINLFVFVVTHAEL